MPNNQNFAKEIILDGLSVIYNRLYETITETDDTSKEAAPGPDDQASGSDEVS